MEKITIYLTNYLCSNNIIEQKDYEIYKFGFQAGIELITCLFCSIMIAKLTRTTISVLIFWGIFFTVRTYIGGIHLKKYMHCFWISLLFSNGSAIINRNHIIYYQKAFWAIGLLVILLLGYVLLGFDKYKKENLYYLKKLALNLVFLLVFIFIFYKTEKWEYISQCTYTLSIIVLSLITDILVCQIKKYM